MRNKNSAPASAESFVRRYRPFFVTLFVLIPVLIVPALLIFTVMKNDSLQKWRTLHVAYENSHGLKKGNPVSMSGITIGYVKEVDLVREKEVSVTFNINSRYTHLARKDTKARLKQRGFVGDWEIELFGGSPGFAEARDNDTLKSDKQPSMDDMIELATGTIDTVLTMINVISAIVRGIEAGEGTVGQLLKNDTLFRHFNQAGANTAGITSNVKALTADAKGIINNTARNADSLIIALAGVGKGGAAFIDTLSALVNTVNRSIGEVMGEIDGILKNVKAVSDDTPELLDRLQYDLGQIELMLKSLQEGWLFKSVGGSAPKNPHLADSP